MMPLMIRTWRWFAVSSCALILLGCPPKKSGDDAGADGASASASAVPEAAPPAAVAANDSDVTKYPDQNPDNQTPLTARMTVTTRSEASTTGGKVVGPIKAGTEADEIADHDGFDLVLYADPNDTTRKIEGWAPHTAFVAEKGVTPPVPVGDGGVKPTPPPSNGFVCMKQNPPGNVRPASRSAGRCAESRAARPATAMDPTRSATKATATHRTAAETECQRTKPTSSCHSRRSSSRSDTSGALS